MDTSTKVIIGGVTVLALGGGTYYLLNKNKKNKAAKEGIELAQTEAQQILKNNAHLPPDQQIRASYTPQQMKTYADKLHTAMDGLGTDNDAVKDVFEKMNNDLDILLLIEQFGVRDDDDLGEWLADDGATEYVNEILETKAMITKRF